MKSIEKVEVERERPWEVVRRTVLERDDHRCQDCGSENALSVHHVTYARYGDEWLEDLITVCGRCHLKRHNMRPYLSSQSQRTEWVKVELEQEASR